MGKSLGNVLDPKELLHEFDNDCIRWYLLKDFKFGNDGDFQRKRFIEIFVSSALSKFIFIIGQSKDFNIFRNISGSSISLFLQPIINLSGFRALSIAFPKTRVSTW